MFDIKTYHPETNVETETIRNLSVIQSIAVKQLLDRHGIKYLTRKIPAVTANAEPPKCGKPEYCIHRDN